MLAPWLKNNSKSRQMLRTTKKNKKPKKQVMKWVLSEKRTRKN